MSKSSAKADGFKAEAEKALNKQSFFGFLNKSQKYEDASDLFTKAGNAYKLINDYTSAGECFSKASDCHIQIENKLEAVSTLVEAGNMYKKVSPADAITCFSKAIEMYNDNGRFQQSARYYKEIAEIYEADQNFEYAIEAYKSAAEIMINDNKKSAASSCLLKVATLASTLGNYTEAADVFEQMGRESMDSNLTKYSATGYLFKAILCHMAAGDNVAYKNKIEDFKGVDYSFPTSRECTFVEQLISAIETFDADAFSQACADFDRITPLDPWKTALLLKIQKVSGISAAGDGDADVC